MRVLAGAGAEIDTTTANGRLVFGIFASLAEFERELIAERTRALSNQFTFKLSQTGKDAKDKPTVGRRRVNLCTGPCQHAQSDTSVA